MPSSAHPLLLVLAAPSGGGKTTLCKNVLARNPRLTRAITCTTRAPRPGERDGVDYYFLTAAGFEQRAQAGAFLEQAVVYGHRYGTLKAEVLDRLRQGGDVLLSIDVQGAASVRACAQVEPELARALCTVFVAPASLAVLEGRLRSRGQDAPTVIDARLRAARQEVAQWRHFDYLLISGTMEEDRDRLEAILAAEHLRSGRAVPPEL